MSTAPADVAPKSGSEPPGLQPAPNSDKKRLKRRRVGIGAAAVVIAVLGLTLSLTVHSRKDSPKFLSSSAQSTGDFLRLRGTTQAVEARAILAPMLAGEHFETMTIIHLTPAGTKVKQGDLLVEFDRQVQMRDIIDKQADYQKLVNQVSEEQAKEMGARAKDETELKTAEDNLRKAELEVQKDEIVSRIDAEKNQENLEEARSTYEQLLKTFDLKRTAAQAAIRILEIQRDRTKETMEHAKANSERMQVRSPLDGVVVLNTIWKEGTMGEVQEGDQVRPGVPFMQVVNPAIMQVRVLANQEDFPALHIGQSAKIQLDAYPGLFFQGKIDQISPIGEGSDFSSKMRNFVVIVSIQGNDPKLMPDLSAAVDVETVTHQSGAVKPDAARSSL